MQRLTLSSLGRLWPGRASRAWAPCVAALILVAVVGLLAMGACVPHTHTGVGAGLYNAEHDLTLLAVAGTVAPIPATMLLSVILVTTSLSPPVPVAPTVFVHRDAESRAPPA
jgi:hypothetical protein